MQRGFASTPAGALHVQSCGDGARTLVLLQILPIGVQMLSHAMELLAQGGLRCVAIDLLGYGLSDRRDASWLVGDFADNIEQALAQLGLVPDYLLGGHFAGMVAAEIAIRHPVQIARLVLDGTPLWPAEYRANIRAEMGLKPIEMTEDGAYLAYFWAMARGMVRKLAPEVEVSAQTAPALHRVVQGFLHTAFQPDVIPAMVAHDMAARIGDISVPTLVVSADHDTQLQWFKPHLAGNAHATGHRFAGTHPMHDFAHPERSAEYVALVLDFLGRGAVA
jgi:L-proline amide hydrolase